MTHGQTHQLYGLEEDGSLDRLRVPADIGDPTEVYDELQRGIYEALRTFDHVRFIGLEEHIERAEQSMVRFGLDGPLDRGALRGALHRVVSEFPAPDSKVRFDVLAGPAEALGTSARIVLQATELVLPPEHLYTGGARVGLASGRKRERPGVKEAQWVVDRRSVEQARDEDLEPILVDDDSRMLEGTMSNFFALRDGVLHTAPTSGVLPGVTRRFVIELAERLEIGVREEALLATELERIDEAFYSTSVRSIVPIVAIAGQALGAGQPGDTTRRLMRAYAEMCSRDARPAIAEETA